MRIDLERIQEKPFSWQETLEFSPEELAAPELAALGPVAVEGKLTFVESGYLLTGRLRYVPRLVCDRCLREVPETRDIPLELLVLTHAKAPEAEEQELEEKDLSVVHLSGDILDTEPLVVEQIQLNIPMKPLCRPDCAGLCPVCGIDLNEESCDCERQTPDPRWAALAALKGRLEER